MSRVSRNSLLFRMLLLVLALITARGIASALDTPLQICLGQAEGGLGCRCTTTYTAVVDPSLNVDCSSRNLSALPVEWQISQDARHLDLSRNQLSSLVKGKDGSTQFIALIHHCQNLGAASLIEHIPLCCKLSQRETAIPQSSGVPRGVFKLPLPPKFRRPSKIVTNSTQL